MLNMVQMKQMRTGRMTTNRIDLKKKCYCVGIMFGIWEEESWSEDENSSLATYTNAYDGIF